MMFFKKCIIYKDDKDIVIHDKVRIKNTENFYYGRKEYAELIIRILMQHAGYSKQDILAEIKLIISFVVSCCPEGELENYKLYIYLLDYCKELD